MEVGRTNKGKERLVATALLAWVALLIGLVSSSGTALAAVPFPYQPEPVGNRGVAINWAYCTSSLACWQVDVLDWSGDSRVAAAKSTQYYVQAWNGYKNSKLYVIKDVSPIPYGTPVVLATEAQVGEPQQKTHAHLYTNAQHPGSCGAGVVETNGHDWVDCTVVHIGEGTLKTGPSSVATVISHEVGHNFYLDDVSGTGTDTIMHSPNPGIMTPTYSDKRTAAECRYVSYC